MGVHYRENWDLTAAYQERTPNHALQMNEYHRTLFEVALL